MNPVLPIQPSHNTSGQEAPQGIPILYSKEKAIYEPFLNEARHHIQTDMEDIRGTFFSGVEVESVDITIAGDETHYGGKVPLFLDFKLKGQLEPVRIVYKPRSIKPDQAIENFRAQIDSNHQPRKMLDKTSHGYDFFVKGSTLSYLTNSEASQRINEGQVVTLENLLDNPKHLALVQALSMLGVEDLHVGNFLYDQENDELHFIDAECYQTGVCLNLDDLLTKKGGLPSQRALDVLSGEPTRLVFCATQAYVDYYNGHSHFAEPLVFIEGNKSFVYVPDNKDAFECKPGELEKNFLDYHDALFLKFLHVNGLFKWGGQQGENVTNTNINQMLRSLIGEKGMIKLEAILHEVGRFRGSTGLGEVPSFHFDFKEKKVICDFTKDQIAIGNSN